MRYALIILSLMMETALAVPSVTLRATPTSGVAPLRVTLTWNATDLPNGTVCMASGGAFKWSGVQPPNGTLVITSVSKKSRYIINCTAEGVAELIWEAPTKNTDGTNIPATGPGSLTGFYVYNAATEAILYTRPQGITVPATGRSVVLDKLPAGPRFFGLIAVNAEGLESDMVVVSSEVVGVNVSSEATVTIGIAIKPSSPSNLVITNVKVN